MIQTKEFAITQKEYFKTLLTLHYRKYWWLYALALLLAYLLAGDFGHDKFSTFFVLYPIVLFIWLFLTVYRAAYSSKNKIVFLPRQLTIDQEKISGLIDKTSVSEVELKYIVKVLELKNMWLLYISRTQFIFIPKAGFVSAGDMVEFEVIIKGLKI